MTSACVQTDRRSWWWPTNGQTEDPGGCVITVHDQSHLRSIVHRPLSSADVADGRRDD
jgi:hypothetical protein